MMPSPFHVKRQRSLRRGKSHKENIVNHNNKDDSKEEILDGSHKRNHECHVNGNAKKNTPSLKLCKKWLIGELKRVKKENLLLRAHVNSADATELVRIKQTLALTLQKKSALRRKYKALVHIHKSSLVEIYNLAAAENDALRNDISLLGNVVQRLSEELEKHETASGLSEELEKHKTAPGLSEELEKYETKPGLSGELEERETAPGNQLKDSSPALPANHKKVVPIPDSATSQVSKLCSRREVHIFAPLLVAYDALLSDRASLLAQYRSDAARLRRLFKTLSEENRALRASLLASESARTTDVHRVETMMINKELLEEQNEVLIQKVHLFNTSLNLLLSKYERLEIRNLQLSRQNNSLARVAQLGQMRQSLQQPVTATSNENSDKGDVSVDNQQDSVETTKTILQLKRQILLLRERNAMLLKRNVGEHSECISKRVHENIVQYLQSMFDELTRKYRENNKERRLGKEQVEKQTKPCEQNVEPNRTSVKQSEMFLKPQMKTCESITSEWKHSRRFDRQQLVEQQKLQEQQKVFEESKERSKRLDEKLKLKKLEEQMDQCEIFEKKQEHMSEKQFDGSKRLEDGGGQSKLSETQIQTKWSDEKWNQSRMLSDEMDHTKQLNDQRKQFKLLDQQKQVNILKEQLGQSKKLKEDQCKMIKIRRHIAERRIENIDMEEETKGKGQLKRQQHESDKYHQSSQRANSHTEQKQHQQNQFEENLKWDREEIDKMAKDNLQLMDDEFETIEDNKESNKMTNERMDQQIRTRNLVDQKQKRLDQSSESMRQPVQPKRQEQPARRPQQEGHEHEQERQEQSFESIRQQRQPVQPKIQGQQPTRTPQQEGEEKGQYGQPRQEQSSEGVQQFLYARTRL